MSSDIYHTIVFQERNPTQLRTISNSAQRLISPVVSNTSGQFSGANSLRLFENAVGRVYQILRYIELSGPYIDKYGPIIKEVPTMYRLMKAFNEYADENEPNSIQSNVPVINAEEDTHNIDASLPKLFI